MQAVALNQASSPDTSRHVGTDWRCTCGKVLGVIHGRRLHIRSTRSHEYFVGIPVSAVCRRCRKVNELKRGV